MNSCLQRFYSQNIPTLKYLENPVAVSDSMSTPDTTTDSHDRLKRSLLPQAFVHPLLGGLWVLLDTTVEIGHGKSSPRLKLIDNYLS